MASGDVTGTSADRSVGFIGLGNMGWPMAANLVRAGFSVVAGDLDTAREQKFARELGAVAAGGPAGFGRVGALVTMLPDGDAVRAALLDSGVADALPPGTLVIDMSSVAPAGTRELGMALAQGGYLLVDAPVSGGKAKAVDGTLSVMLGADDEAAAERAVPIIDAMSRRIFRTGGLGSGHALKALNNYVLAAGFVAAAEALVTGAKFGLDPAVIVEVLNASSGRNVATETVIPSQVLTRRFEEGFPFQLLCKDVGIAAGLADRLEVEAPLCGAVAERLAQVAAELGWDTDYTRAVVLWEQRAGIDPPAC
jgi:3-hydroxyisobutyrate dehydrogenase